MAVSKFTAAINQICDEKNLPKEIVIETIEAALAAAYKKDYGSKNQHIEAKFDEETGEVKIREVTTVVEEVENPEAEISLEEAKKVKKDAKLGDQFFKEVTPTGFGRIAAQTAKQVIIQKIKEAERALIYSEFKSKEGELVTGVVQRLEGNNVYIDFGRGVGIMFPYEQIPGERYYIGQRIKVYVISVAEESKGPQIVVSRSHPGFLKKVFELEIPEIPAGTVEIKSIAREAGYRSKVAVASKEENIDPVGSCVGQRGTRIGAIINELGGEKVDIILWDEDPAKYIANALAPAKVSDIKIDNKKKEAIVKVPEDQLSLAIGKSGQNVRLAAKLTGWKIDIEGSEKVSGEEKESQVLEGDQEEPAKKEESQKTLLTEDSEKEDAEALEEKENVKQSSKNDSEEAMKDSPKE